MSRWFRHYAGMMRDEKLVRVAVRAKQPVERVVWVWGAILESAAEINDNGRYEFDIGEAAYFLRCDEGDMGDVLDSLAHLGRLHEGVVARWGDRQYTSDGAAERQRRYRERVKDRNGNGRQRTGNVQSGALDVTRDVTPPSRDGEVTAQETDTETYQKEAPNGASKKRGTRLPDDFEPDWGEAQRIGLSPEQIHSEREKFRDYWRAQPGQRGVKLDWPATWRNWCRNAPKPRANAPPINGRQGVFDAYRELEREGYFDSEPRSSTIDNGNAQRLSAKPGSEHEGRSVDLRPGFARRLG